MTWLLPRLPSLPSSQAGLQSEIEKVGVTIVSKITTFPEVVTK